MFYTVHEDMVVCITPKAIYLPMKSNCSACTRNKIEIEFIHLLAWLMSNACTHEQHRRFMCARTQSQMYPRTHARACPSCSIRSRTHAHTCMHARSCEHARARTRKHTHAPTHYAIVRTCKRTQKHAPTCSHNTNRIEEECSSTCTMQDNELKME